MQSHQDDDRRGHPAKHVEPLANELTESGRRRAKAYENRRDAGREKERRQNRVPPEPGGKRLVCLQNADARSGEVGKIERYDWQNTGRKERKKPCQECTGERNIEHLSAVP
jgi:hypothetical protein